MRMRKKPWARPELDACSFFIRDPEKLIGKWHDSFEKNQDTMIELGCGKGMFISKIASSNPNTNFIAVDIKDEMLGLAKRKIENAYETIGAYSENIKLTCYEIMIINRILSENDNIKRIYINFCNPWHKYAHVKRRLTHPNQLNQYKKFLSKDGEIWFKSDDDILFETSVNYFEESGFKIKYITRDLYNSDFKDTNIQTEHEKMYIESGKKIKFLIAGL